MLNRSIAAAELTQLVDDSTVVGLIAKLVRHTLLQSNEIETAAILGVDCHERSEERLGHSNVYLYRLFTTLVGNIHLRIPKLRTAGIKPSILGPSLAQDVAWCRLSTPW